MRLDGDGADRRDLRRAAAQTAVSRGHLNPVKRPLPASRSSARNDAATGAGTGAGCARSACPARRHVGGSTAGRAAAAPTAQSLGLPIYPAAQYLTTYDAGRGQKYVLFGTTAAFAEIVTYYKNQLKEGGELVFREPPTHTWDVGRFREETMVFRPASR